MARTIRFHLDENCDPKIAEAIRRRGIDVTTTEEASLLEAADETHLEYCRGQDRVLVTHDADFLRMNAAGAETPGIVVCHPDKYSLGEIARRLILIWEALDAEEMTNRVEWI